MSENIDGHRHNLLYSIDDNVIYLFSPLCLSDWREGNRSKASHSIFFFETFYLFVTVREFMVMTSKSTP